MAEAQLTHRALFQVSRLFKDPALSPTGLVERLFAEHRRIAFHDLAQWDETELSNALALSEELIAQYALHFHDARVIPVTYYKREKLVRRHLDQEFSQLLKELARRTGGSAEPTLILEEPIYYLMQKLRDRKFPKPRSAFAALEVLKARFHGDLALRFGRDPFSDNPRRVLLPHEIR